MTFEYSLPSSISTVLILDLNLPRPMEAKLISRPPLSSDTQIKTPLIAGIPLRA